MNASQGQCNRREFARATVLAGSVVSLSSMTQALGGSDQTKPITVGVIGCGSVSHAYLPVLSQCPYVRLVSTCDIRPERARAQAARFQVPHHYPHIDDMLAGEPFDLLVNLTDMQQHERLNRQALQAGRHVWSEKPIANSLAAGQELLRLATGRELLVTAQHALHVLEIITAARQSQESGERIALSSTFPWPIVGA